MLAVNASDPSAVKSSVVMTSKVMLVLPAGMVTVVVTGVRSPLSVVVCPVTSSISRSLAGVLVTETV